MIIYYFLLLIARLATSDEEDSPIDNEDLDVPVHTVVTLPCEADHSWFASGLKLEEDEYHKILANGSLWVHVRMEDMEYIYQCQSKQKLPDGSLKTSRINYHINPLEPAFLARSVENITVDWGTLYTFPCSFSGATPRNEFMIFNGKVVTELRHNITEDSVVECRVSNELGEEHAKAFITVRPGSKERAMKDGIPTGPHCMPYQQLLNSSICLPYIADVADSIGENQYMIARFRSYDADRTNAALAGLFASWDELLLHMQFGDSTQPFETVSRSDNQTISFNSWRCLDWAKRLACVLSYPRCQSVTEYPMEIKPNEFYIEHPICRTHCLAVSGLFCLASLNATSNTSALDSLLDKTFAGNNKITGWDQLLQAAQSQLTYLPSAFAGFHEGQSAMNVLKTCDSSPIGSIVDCTQLPLEKQFSPPASLFNKSVTVEVPVDRSTGQCVAGNGRNYHGTITNSACLPWDSVRNQASGTTSTWPGLLAITPQSFPMSLDSEARSVPACRNPGGLAPQPFCLTVHSSNESSSNHINNVENNQFWKVALCTDIPICPPVVIFDEFNSSPDSSVPLYLSATKIQVIVACVLLTCLLFFVLIVYAVWRINRCGIRSLSSSSLCLSAIEFTELGKERSEIFMESDSTDDNKKPRQCHRFSDTLSEQVYLQHRLLWIKRRRKLRQLNGPCQCALGFWYVTVDFLTCRRKPPEPGSTVVVVTASGEQATQSTDGFPYSSTLDARAKHHKFNRGWCPLLQRIFSVKKRDYRRPGTQCKKSCPKIRRLGIPLQNREDDEFEEKALGLQLHKPVAYVANITSNSSRKISSIGNANHNSCMNCGVIGHLAFNLCETCQAKYGTADDHSKVSDSLLNQQQCYPNSELMPLNCGDYDPGLSLTESSLQLINSSPADLGWDVTLEKLFNMASMTHLLHPKLKQVCYPRQKLVELHRLAKRAFGWIILAYAPNLHNLVRRHRLLSVTSAEQLGLTLNSDKDNDRRSADSTLDESTQDPLVVIKMLANDASLETEANFLREAEVLIELSHKNIIQLLGVCLPLKPLSLLLEYMPFGDLTTFLKHYEQSDGDSRIFPQHLTPTLLSAMNGEVISRTRTRTDVACPTDLRATHKHSWLPPIKLTFTNLMEMALDACDAMVYLSDNYYVHRDVATRSFLVGNKMVIKLADFSMCRPVQPGVDFVAVQGVYLPIKWLPLESILDGVFQVDTDVWSFGVFLWELLTYASEPYPDLNHEQVITFLENGGRLSSPTNCPPTLYNLMLSCWESQRNQRPTFSQIRQKLHAIFTEISNPD